MARFKTERVADENSDRYSFLEVISFEINRKCLNTLKFSKSDKTFTDFAVFF